jgi:hypothetical protein
VQPLLPLGAAAAPLRATHHADLRRVATWALERGRSCDLDVVALCFPALEWLRGADGLVLDRPGVNSLVTNLVANEASGRRTILPDDWPVHLWTLVSWLHEGGQPVARSEPLPIVLEPLMCYGGLGSDGYPRTEGVDVDFACQCFVPHDPTCPPGIGQHIVGHDESGPLVVRARLRPRSAPVEPASLQPLRQFLRRFGPAQGGQPPLDDFVHLGCIDAAGRAPALWLYSYRPGARRGRELALAEDGVPWTARPDRRFRARFRWVRGRPPRWVASTDSSASIEGWRR